MKQWKEVLPVLCSDRMYTALNDLEAFSSKYGILPKLDYALDMFSMVLPQNVRVVFVAHPRTRARAGGDGPVGLRRRIGESFELAALPGTTEEDRRKALHFCVVGGGPTGVEFAGTLRDFAGATCPGSTRS